MVNYSTDINKTNNHLTSNHWAQKRSQHLFMKMQYIVLILWD